VNIPTSHIPNRDERDALLEKYTPLIIQQANYWHRRNPTVAHDDLMQTGRLALLRAQELYDSMKGSSFITCAFRRISADMRYYVARTRDTICVSTEHFPHVRIPTCSLDLEVGDDEGRPLTFLDTLSAPQREPLLSDDAVLRKLLRAAVAGLSLKQRHIIEQLYLAPQPLSRKEVGATLGVTRQAVELKLKKALRNLRCRLQLKGALS